jgi:hypothetical protein
MSHDTGGLRLHRGLRRRVLRRDRGRRLGHHRRRLALPLRERRGATRVEF